MCKTDLCLLGRALFTRWDTIVQTLFSIIFSIVLLIFLKAQGIKQKKGGKKVRTDEYGHVLGNAVLWT